MARGNRRGEIFLDDEDRKTFLRSLAQCCERTGIVIYAWVLMDNHYHLALCTPKGNLVEAMKWLQNTYTRRFNSRHRAWGRVFGDRYKSVLVDREGGGAYLPTLLDYIHLNPARARIVGGGKTKRKEKKESLLDYPWSSLVQAYAVSPGKRARWMRPGVEEGLSVLECKDTVAGRRRLVEGLDQRSREEEAEKCGLVEVEGQSLQSSLRRGWYWGKESFKEKLLERLAETEGVSSNRNYATSPQSVSVAEEMKERILALAMEHFSLNGMEELQSLGRGDERRVAVAWALWSKTTLRHGELALLVGYRTAANFSQQAIKFDKREEKELNVGLRKWKRKMKNVE